MSFNCVISAALHYIFMNSVPRDLLKDNEATSTYNTELSETTTALSTNEEAVFKHRNTAHSHSGQLTYIDLKMNNY